MLYILIAILVFGFLILIHEFGHYITARMCGVQIHEFAIGMGPKLVWYTSKKTGIVYSIRMFPIGGFVSMLGENPDADDARPHPETMPDGSDFDPSRSLANKPAWQRFIVNAAGATMNLLFGFLVMGILAAATPIGSTVVGQFLTDLPEGAVSSQTQGLALGDKIIAVNGKKVHIAEQLYYRIMHDGVEPLRLTVIRDGQKMEIPVTFSTTVESGITVAKADFRLMAERKTIGTVAKHGFYKSVYAVGMIWESMLDMVTGKYTVEAMSGPVGVAGAISDAAKDGLGTLAVVAVIISINLGIFNLLPFPALDGGHLLFIVVEMITGKKVPAKVGAIFDMVGLMLLFALMIFVTFQDITKIIF